jgi:hypothetical protein
MSEPVIDRDGLAQVIQEIEDKFFVAGQMDVTDQG